MSGITDPSEEYFKDGLWAWVTNQWKKLIGDAAGHLQVDVVESGLPTGAATSANQTTMITALQLIDDLRAALNSVGTDELDVVIDGQSADVEIKQQTAADLTPGVCGWDGSAWRKLPLVWGYSAIYAENETSLDVAAGHRTLTFSTVPAGEVWVVTTAAAYCSTAGPSSISFLPTVDGATHTIKRVACSAAWLSVDWGGMLVLEEGDSFSITFYDCDLNDDIVADACGYKMKIAE